MFFEMKNNFTKSLQDWNFTLSLTYQTTKTKAMKTQILDKTWKVSDLQLIASTKLIKDLVSEYQKDPNCRPYDFVAGENISDFEKASFISAVSRLTHK